MNTDKDAPTPTTDTGLQTPHEVVGLFADEKSLLHAIRTLRENGFDRADLSVLGSHQSLEVTKDETPPWRDVFTTLASDAKFEVPLVASGAVMLAGGPMVATIAALVGAAVSGVAAKEVIDGLFSQPHREEYTRSVEAGSIILWVRVDHPDQSEKAMDLLRKLGARNVHIHSES